MRPPTLTASHPFRPTLHTPHPFPVACTTRWLLGAVGVPPPARYVHADGGIYRGQWAGAAKQGVGVYMYPSGARYEGQWHSGVKAGRGVYVFPGGGRYEGEWRAGAQDGVGVRVLKSGSVKAGVWRGGKLEAALPLWQCAAAAAGATAAPGCGACLPSPHTLPAAARAPHAAAVAVGSRG